MTGPVSLYVDPVELGRVQAELQALVADQSYCDALMDPDATAMGGAEVAAAVRDFTQRWDAQRNRIVADLTECAAFVATAVRNYESAEHELKTSVFDFVPLPVPAQESRP